MKNNERKNLLIKAASKRFSRLGYYKTTLEEVARDIRIGKATIYHYFASKDDLYLSVLEWESIEIIQKIKDIFNNEGIDFVERFVKYFELKDLLIQENRSITNLLLNKFSDKLTEKELTITDKFISDEIDIMNLFISFIYREQIEKFENKIPAEIVYLSWMTAFAKFRLSGNDKTLYTEARIKSLIKTFLP
jgi:AcrR family transcriptional regulator